MVVERPEAAQFRIKPKARSEIRDQLIEHKIGQTSTATLAGILRLFQQLTAHGFNLRRRRIRNQEPGIERERQEIDMSDFERLRKRGNKGLERL